MKAEDFYTDEKKRLIACYRMVFGTDEGKKVLQDLIKQPRQFRVNGQSPNELVALYKCAQQDLIAYITNQLEDNH